MTTTEPSGPRLSIAADVGGTFTDFIQVDQTSGALQASKLLTTPDDPSEAVLAGTRQLLAPAPDASLEQLVHGTTLVINALVERKGATTALITTEGLRDILEMRRENRHDVYDLAQPYPEPLIPRPLRKGVPERVTAVGEVLTPLDEAAVRRCAEELRALGVESIAVGFLHAYLNPAHEERVRELLAEAWPEAAVSLSSEVNPEQAEYERFSTTAANAFVKPRMQRYLLKLDRDLANSGLRQPMTLFGSHGGIIPVQTAAELPITLVESGPAGGALAAAHLAGLLGLNDVLAVDMGGTTAKMVGVRDGRVITRYDYEAARVDRFSPGSGLPLRIPVVDIIEIGAGGGSIARIDEFGLLTVGPESAGAAPGPASYGRGGTQPTVTDADVLLGRLAPEDFLGGRMPLSRDLAERAIGERLGSRLNLSLPEIAMGISDVVDEHMAITAAEYLRERGIDPRRVAMVAYGGMGPVHAVSLAERLQISEVLIPPMAGVFSALGFLLAPRSLELTQTYHRLLGDCDYSHLAQTAIALAERACGLMNAAPTARAEFTAGMRYRGQWHAIDIPLPDPVSEPWTEQLIAARFLEGYARLYEQISEDIPMEMLTLRARVTEPASTLQLPGSSANGAPEPTPEGTREVIFSRGYGKPVAMSTPRLRRDGLPIGYTVDGPSIVLEDFTTTVVPGGWTMSVEPFNILRIRRD